MSRTRTQEDASTAPIEIDDGSHEYAMIKITGENGEVCFRNIARGATFEFGRNPAWKIYSNAISRRHGRFEFNGHFVFYRHICGNQGLVSLTPQECLFTVLPATLDSVLPAQPASELSACFLPPEISHGRILANAVTMEGGYGFVLYPGNKVGPLGKMAHDPAYTAGVEIVKFYSPDLLY
jgi:hypothetical protein